MADQPDSIFGDQSATQPPVVPQVPASNGTNAQPDAQLADLLMSIKNERGEPKYKTVQDALVALQHSQQYIPNLTAQLAQRDQELAQARAEQERIAELERTVQALTQPQTPPVTTPAGMSAEQIADLVNATLSNKEKQATAVANTKTVVTTLQQSFGADADKKFYEKAEQLGLSKEQMNAMAASSPSAVLAWFGVAAQGKQSTAAPTQPSINTSAFQPQQHSYLGRNDKSAMVGATTEELHQEAQKARSMVEELHSQGRSVHELTDPRVFYKTFGKT